eukprot:TRINITY_DN49897_c0_g1_i1.p1 TRINITY_DN49897_c0_g1~~TRINITY_DN49897_c0_g1_i1.p1  ORF type:complete len:564 (-),score=25.44 TRINITY_DN49897_c0_g1_i1:247-1905(-)
MCDFDTANEPAGRAALYKEYGNRKFKERNYEAARISYLHAFVMCPLDHRIIANVSQCYAQLQRWHTSAEAAWLCMHLNPEFPKGPWRLARALLELKLLWAAQSVVHDGLLSSPGNESLLLLQQEVLQEDLAQLDGSSTDNDRGRWDAIAAWLSDRDVLELSSVARTARLDIREPSCKVQSRVELSRDNGFSGLWRHFPPWVVSMYSSKCAAFEVHSGYEFADSDELRRFLHAAHIVSSWADVHEGSSQSFAVYRFADGKLREFASKPIEDGYHGIYSQPVFLRHCHKTGLSLHSSVDIGQVADSDGSFVLSFGERFLDDVRVGNRKVLALSFLLDSPIILTADLVHGGSSHGTYTVEVGTPLYNAILEGRPIPFIVGIQCESLTTERGIPCPCGAEARDVKVTHSYGRKRCERCGKAPERMCEDMFVAGDRLVAEESFTTMDEVPMTLPAGQCARVLLIDDDGNALLQFDGSGDEGWVARNKFHCYHSKFWKIPLGATTKPPLPPDRYSISLSGPSRVFRCDACGRHGQYCWLCIMDFGAHVAHSFATTRDV